MSALLEAWGLTVVYGGVVALQSADLTVAPGELVGLIGANGAGKTTLLACLSGHVTPATGRVRYRGGDVSGLGPDARARRGIVRSFQDARLFPTMPVWQALLLAEERRVPTGTATGLLGLPAWRAGENRRSAEALQLATTMGLEEQLDRLVGELSTGLRRVLDLACAIALGPRLLLLDEPSAGLATAEAAGLAEVITRVRTLTGATVVMVEHDLPLVWSLADRIVVLEEGAIVASGRPPEVRDHPAVAFGDLG
jgi:ABC-type branched-subunit amino acid transport system ATPase component